MGKLRDFSSWRAVTVTGLAVVALGGRAMAAPVGPASAAGATSSAPGVSATQIDIGAISSKTGPLAGYFGGLSPGMSAYFKLIDGEGGVDGRQIVLTDDHDDGGSPTQFTQDTHVLIDQDHVFAVGVA